MIKPKYVYRSHAHDNDVRRMYDEMESQIREEREHAAQIEREKAERLRQEMDAEMRARDEQIQAMMRKYSTVGTRGSPVGGRAHMHSWKID